MAILLACVRIHSLINKTVKERRKCCVVWIEICDFIITAVILACVCFRSLMLTAHVEQK